MKKEYVAPVIVGEEFSANEYVAVCWGVACIVGGNGDYGGYGEEKSWAQWSGTAPYGDQCDNHAGSCSNAANNQFRIDANGTVSFYAENNDQQGSLNGGYTSYIDNNSNSIIDGGDTIFWYTLGARDMSNKNGRRWNHYGTVVNADSKHPNRS